MVKFTQGLVVATAFLGMTNAHTATCDCTLSELTSAKASSKTLQSQLEKCQATTQASQSTINSLKEQLEANSNTEATHTGKPGFLTTEKLYDIYSQVYQVSSAFGKVVYDEIASIPNVRPVADRAEELLDQAKEMYHKRVYPTAVSVADAVIAQTKNAVELVKDTGICEQYETHIGSHVKEVKEQVGSKVNRIVDKVKDTFPEVSPLIPTTLLDLVLTIVALRIAFGVLSWTLCKVKRTLSLIACILTWGSCGKRKCERKPISAASLSKNTAASDAGASQVTSKSKGKGAAAAATSSSNDKKKN